MLQAFWTPARSLTTTLLIPFKPRLENEVSRAINMTWRKKYLNVVFSSSMGSSASFWVVQIRKLVRRRRTEEHYKGGREKKEKKLHLPCTREMSFFRDKTRSQIGDSSIRA